MRNAIACYLTIASGCTGEGVIWLNGKMLERDREDGEFICPECSAKLAADNDAEVLAFVESTLSEGHEGSAGLAPLPGTHDTFVNWTEVDFYDLAV